MPGHAFSWGVGHPEMVASCPGYGDALDIGHVNAVPMDPSNPTTYTIVDSVVRELLTLIQPQELVHLGGDEINVGCWNWSNSTHASPIKTWKEKNHYTWPEVTKLFYRTVWNNLMNDPTRPPPAGIHKVVTWEDLYLNQNTGTFDFNSPDVPFNSNEAIIEVWTNTKYLSQVVAAGYDGVYAAGWYLDRQQPVEGVVGWEWLDTMWQMYDIDPEADIEPVDLVELKGRKEGKEGKEGKDRNGGKGRKGTSNRTGTVRTGRVLGGEASMWSEQVNTLTLDGRMWPRACTVAERLWSSRNTTEHEYAALRLREHRCRMVELWGIKAGPFWSDRW